MTEDRRSWMASSGEPFDGTARTGQGVMREWPVEGVIAVPEARKARKAAEIEELARRQGVKPFTTMEEFATWNDPFESDEEHEAFLEWLYDMRRDG